MCSCCAVLCQWGGLTKGSLPTSLPVGRPVLHPYWLTESPCCCRHVAGPLGEGSEGASLTRPLLQLSEGGGASEPPRHSSSAVSDAAGMLALPSPLKEPRTPGTPGGGACSGGGVGGKSRRGSAADTAGVNLLALLESQASKPVAGGGPWAVRAGPCMAWPQRSRGMWHTPAGPGRSAPWGMWHTPACVVAFLACSPLQQLHPVTPPACPRLHC